MDNASVCDVLARSAGVLLMQKYGLQFHAQNARIRCMAHVVNLVVQAILAELNEADDPEQEDYYIPNKHIPFHYDLDDDEEVRQMEDEEDEEGGEDSDDDDDFVKLLHSNPEDNELGPALDSAAYLSEVKMVRHWIVQRKRKSELTYLPHQLRAITKKICSSPQRRKQFRLLSKQVFGSIRAPHPSNKQLCELMVIRDVVTRWNYTHAMIKRALLLRRVRVFVSIPFRSPNCPSVGN